jgi:hypothetical protein
VRDVAQYFHAECQINIFYYIMVNLTIPNVKQRIRNAHAAIRRHSVNMFYDPHNNHARREYNRLTRNVVPYLKALLETKRQTARVQRTVSRVANKWKKRSWRPPTNGSRGGASYERLLGMTAVGR